MTLILSPHAQQIVNEQLTRGIGRPPAEIVERALETMTLAGPITSFEDEERR